MGVRAELRVFGLQCVYKLGWIISRTQGIDDNVKGFLLENLKFQTVNGNTLNQHKASSAGHR